MMQEGAGKTVALWLYLIGNFATFIYLAVEDWQTTNGILSFLFCLAVDVFLASIWPLYWGVLHWIA